MNAAKQAKMNEDNHYLCSDCGIFCDGREITIASFANVQS